MPKPSKTPAKKAPEAPEEKTPKTPEARILAGLNEVFGKTGAVRTLAAAAEQAKKEVIPTTIDVLDHYVLGHGGLLVGRCTEMLGDPDAGKTSLLQRFLASAQKCGGIGVLVESENTLVHERGIAYGIDPKKLILTEPPSIDDVLAQVQAVLDLIPTGVGPNLVGWDSLAASPAASIFKGKNPAGSKARLMSDIFPAITKLLLPKRAHLCIINQVRYKIGVAFGDPTTSPGGETLKFMASARLQLWRGKAIMRGDAIHGHYVTVKSIKNKMTPPSRKVKLRLDYETGWNNDWAMLSLAKDLDLIDKETKFSPESSAEARAALEKHESWWHPG